MARLGKREEALAAYGKALEIDPACPSAHLNLAVVAIQTGNFADAEQHYRQALPGRPTAEAHNGLGYVLARQGRTDEAFAEYRTAIGIDASYTPAYNNLADGLARQDRNAEAEELYRKSIELKPSASVYAALGDVQRRLGKNAEAEEQYARAKALGTAAAH